MFFQRKMKSTLQCNVKNHTSNYLVMLYSTVDGIKELLASYILITFEGSFINY